MENANFKKRGIIVFVFVMAIAAIYMLGRNDVSDIREPIEQIRSEQQNIEVEQCRATQAIERAERASKNIEAGIELIERSAWGSAAILEQNESIYRAIRESCKP